MALQRLEERAALARAAGARERVEDRVVGLARPVVLRRLSPREPQRRLHGRVREEGAHEGGLADAGLAGDEDHLPRSRAYRIKRRPELGQLALAPDDERPNGRGESRQLRRRRRGRCFDLGLADEPVAAAMERLDVARADRLVAQRAPQLLYASGEGGIADHGPAPYHAEKLLLADHAAPFPCEEAEEREGLRRKAHRTLAARQAGARIQMKWPEGNRLIQHGNLAASLAWASRDSPMICP